MESKKEENTSTTENGESRTSMDSKKEDNIDAATSSKAQQKTAEYIRNFVPPHIPTHARGMCIPFADSSKPNYKPMTNLWMPAKKVSKGSISKYFEYMKRFQDDSNETDTPSPEKPLPQEKESEENINEVKTTSTSNLEVPMRRKSVFMATNQLNINQTAVTSPAKTQPVSSDVDSMNNPSSSENCATTITEKSKEISQHKTKQVLPEEPVIPSLLTNDKENISTTDNCESNMDSKKEGELLPNLVETQGAVKHKSVIKAKKRHAIAHHDSQSKSSRAESRRWLCDVCGKTYTQSSHLWQHKLIHEDKNKHVCDIPSCSRTFSTRGKLDDHKRSCHTTDRPFQCEECNMTFKTSSVLYQHRQKHQGARFQCDTCDKVFTRAHSLKRHMLVHTDERPFGCLHCEKRFRQQWDLNTHVRRMHETVAVPQQESLTLEQSKMKAYSASNPEQGGVARIEGWEIPWKYFLKRLAATPHEEDEEIF